MAGIAANLEWLFTEAGDDTAARIHAAARHGLEAVEIWGWRDKDLDAIEGALRATGVQLLSLIVDPQLPLADPAKHDAYLVGVRESLAVAERLGAPNLVVVSGEERAGVSPAAQTEAVVSVLSRAARLLDGSEVTLLLEPLNTRVDHPGAFVSGTRQGLDIVREVGSPRLVLLLDAYHALMMGEDLTEAVGDDIALVGHVQVADLPGRHQPGTGTVDWRERFEELRGLGYRGAFGMEYVPTVGTEESLALVEEVANR